MYLPEVAPIFEEYAFTAVSYTHLDVYKRQLCADRLDLSSDGSELTYTYDAQGERSGIVALLKDLNEAAIVFKDLHTTQSSLEEIFVSLVKDAK